MVFLFYCIFLGVATGKNVRFSTPVAHRIQGHRLDMSNGEGLVLHLHTVYLALSICVLFEVGFTRSDSLLTFY